MIIFAILILLMAVAISIFAVWMCLENEKTIEEFETMQYLLFLTCSLEEGENNDDG